MIYTGDEAHKVCDLILAANAGQDEYSNPIEGYPVNSAGYWKENGSWVAFDNRDYKCWVEEFKFKKDAEKWIKEG